MTTPANPLLFLLQIISSLLITLLLLNVMKVSSIIIWRRKTAHTTPPLPPGTCGLPLIGETLSFLAANNSSRGFYDFVRIRRQRYGNCFKTNIFGKTHVFVSSNEAAKLILGNDSIDFTKRYISSIAELLGDQSLLCASQGNHRLVRSHMSRLFSADSLSSSVRLFDKMTIEALTNWKQKQTVVVLDEALKITFRAICKMLISLEAEDELQMLQKDVSEVSEAMLAIPSNLPWTRFSRGLKARKRIMNALLEIINARRNGLEFHEDFLQSLLMKDESSGGYSLTDTQIQDNILTLIIAGQITTASAIAWMVKYLDENKEVQDQLRDLNLALASKIPGSPLELEFLNEMPYASKIVKESLRMATIVSWFPRIALRDCVIEGYQIKKGWIVNVDARHIHSDSMLYEDPTKFCPARFDEDQKPYSFLAFGMGGRTCLGMNLAKALMLVFLHRLVTTYRWKVTDSDLSLEKWALFPRLKSGCPISLESIEMNATP